MKSQVAFLLSSSLFSLSLFAEKPDPKSLEFTKWTPDFQVPDPVAISFDNQGRAYVTQTQRRKANDLDIRQNRDWIPDDLSFKTPDDKRAFYHKKFTPENSDANKKRVKDFNKDGKHDLKDLQFLSERIHLIEDTDGNGLADKISIYAEDFSDEIGGIAAGVLHHEGNVYTTIVPDVWKLRDTNDDGKADTRGRLATGFGVHLAYAGHDMHGLTVGPDGRIYWTIGDKGVGATSREGLHFKYPNHGALLRCDPDGSNFEVYARGLRNVQEIAFDQFGNIFGVDNDSDRPGEKERFVYIVRHMDAGWRSNWQYVKNYNPWMDENLSVPHQKNQPAYITPPISLYKDGPAGMAFNPGTALNEEWQNYFFHTSAPNGQQWGFQVEQNGASFTMINDMQVSNGVPIVGVNFGPDGALYGADWGGGYPLNKKGAVWKWDVAKKHPLRKETAAKLKSDSSTLAVDLLVKDLGHADQRVRLKAQFELVKRGLQKELQLAAGNSTQLGRIHAIWGISQLNRQSKSPDFQFLLGLLNDSDEEIQSQVVKTIGDHFGTQLALHQAPAPSAKSSSLTQTLRPLLKGSPPRLKFHTAIALGNIGNLLEPDSLHDLLGQATENKTYLRHAAVLLATGCLSEVDLVSLAKHKSELVQKVAIVALRRRAAPGVAQFLASPHQPVVAEAARAIHDDWTIPEAMPALAASLETTPWIKNEALIRRAINANFHLGTVDAAKRVVSFAARSEAPEVLRLEALDTLGKWSEPEKLDRVNGRYRPLDKRDPAVAKDATSTQLKSLLTDENQNIQSQTMSLARSLALEVSADSLIAVAQSNNSLPKLRSEALRGLSTQNHPDLESILRVSLKVPQAEIRIAALDLLSRKNKDAAFEATQTLLQDKKAPLAEKQAAIALLAGSLASPKGDNLLNSFLSSFDTIPAGLLLDFAEAAEKRKLTAPSPDLTHTMYGGNVERGADLFINHLAAQCVRCHRVNNGKGSNIGPNLKNIGRKKDRAYILEALAEPQKVIAEGYGTISLGLKDGSTVAGTYRSEENGIIEIRDAEDKVKKIKATDVKERSEVISTMPPVGLIMTKREIRDIIEYLGSLKMK